MVTKFLFWTSVLLVVAGSHSPEGNLFYFFAVLLLMAAAGRVLHRRSKRLAALVPAAGKPSSPAKAR
jgi:hypothetical protein